MIFILTLLVVAQFALVGLVIFLMDKEELRNLKIRVFKESSGAWTIQRRSIFGLWIPLKDSGAFDTQDEAKNRAVEIALAAPVVSDSDYVDATHKKEGAI